MEPATCIRRAVVALAAALVYPSSAAAQGAPPAPEAPSPAPSSDPLGDLREQVRQLRAEVQAARERPAPAEEKPAPPPAARLGYEPFWPWATPREGISVGAYLQTQYESHQDALDQLSQSGALLNTDRFSVRRARPSFIGEWEYAAVAVELDANTTNGPQVDLRKAEASLQYRPDRSQPPVVMATLGQFDTPFGYELVESPRTRFFMERSVLSRAFWPGEPDLGVRVAGALGFFRWTIAAINGEPLGESTPYTLQDPNAAKDVVFRFGFDVAPRDDLQLAGGISSIRGRGFHPGTPATPATIQWHDTNEDGVIQPFELTPIEGAAATPSQNFDRWAVGTDLRINYRSRCGVTKLYGEFVAGANMDRALYVADPIVNHGLDQRELGYYVGFVQDVTRYGVVGFRFDYYDPNSDAFDARQGRLIPFSEAIKTYSPLVGLVLPDRARLLFQYDFIRNALARTATGVPTNLKNDTWTLRLQVQL
ncbi:MAG TPA: hypothetical protein VKU41_07915 [Polyangiaceae bacterium]|nr:hypothetical protein [Polyangiaceae bacterium]